MADRPNKSILERVIVRADFAIPLPSVGESLPPAVSQASLKLFPDAESPVRGKVGEFQISVSSTGPTITDKLEDTTVWRYRSRDRLSTLSVSPHNVNILYEAYPGYAVMKSHFEVVMAAVYSANTVVQIRRLGLRYVNKLQRPEGDPLEWSEDLSKALLSIFDVYPENKHMIARAFHSLELNFEDAFLRFQYGMHNPDFPSPIVRKVFILDFDAFNYGLIEDQQEMLKCLDRLHGLIEDLFKVVTTERLRSEIDG